MMRVLQGVLMAGLVLLVGCRSTEPVSGPAPPEEAPREVDLETINLAAYEDFDASRYREEPLAADIDVRHEVPRQLMEDRADVGILRTVEGYRIQIFSTQDKLAADERVEEAINWWRAQHEDGRLQEAYAERDTLTGGDTLAVAGPERPAEEALPAQPPVHLIFRQPYYRVRLGDFTTEEEARRLLAFVRKRFPDAFIAQDTVTIRR